MADVDALELCRQHGRDIARQWASRRCRLRGQRQAPEPQDCACAAAAAADLGPMMRCGVCQWVYDPAKGEPNQDVQPGTPWSRSAGQFPLP